MESLHEKIKNEKTQQSKECPLQGICVLYSEMNNRENAILLEEPKYVLLLGFAELLQLQANKRKLTFGRSRETQRQTFSFITAFENTLIVKVSPTLCPKKIKKIKFDMK